MRTITVKKDFDVEADKGAAGIFQVISILDDEGNDLAAKLRTSGLFFENDEMLIKYFRENSDIGTFEEIRIVDDN